MKRVDAKLLDEIVRRLVGEFDPEQIYLFGSHAWGVPAADSDLDLLVIVSQSNERPTARATQGYHALGDIMAPLDILVKTRSEVDDVVGIAGTLVADIVTKGKVLYASDKAFALA